MWERRPSRRGSPPRCPPAGPRTWRQASRCRGGGRARLAGRLDDEEETGVSRTPKSVTPSMPLKTAVPSDQRISAPAPVAITIGTTPRMKANEVIRIGRRRSRQASVVASKRFALLAQLPGELDDQDGVLASQPDQHHEPDLHEDVHGDMPQQDADQGAQQAHRHNQNHRQRQRPTLVQGRQGQKDEDHGQRKDVQRGVAGLDLHVGQVGPLGRHRRRQGRLPQPVNDADALAGAQRGNDDARHRGRRVQVIRVTMAGPPTSRMRTSVSSGTIWPWLLRTAAAGRRRCGSSPRPEG